MRLFIRSIAYTLLPVIFICANSYGDTVILKNGVKLKGLILDEFKDRVVVSTSDGEITLMKSDIRSSTYDSEEKALMQQGRNLLKRRQHVKAYYVFEKALELDPDLVEARERMNYLRSFLEDSVRNDIIETMNKREEIAGAREAVDPSGIIRRQMGMILVPGEKYVTVEHEPDGNFSEKMSGIQDGDRIVAVWGQMMAYMDPEEVAAALISPGEIRMTIERTVEPQLDRIRGYLRYLFFAGYKSIIGATLRLRTEGLIAERLVAGGAFASAGLKDGDMLYRITGKNTRYMPTSHVEDILKENQGKRIEVVFRREVTLWNKSGRIEERNSR